MVSSVSSLAMSAMARISLGIEERSSDFGIAALNVANGFANQDNPIGFSRFGPNNEQGPAFTDMSSMGGLSGGAAVSSLMVNAIQNVNNDTAYTDNSFLDAIKDITLSKGLFVDSLDEPSDEAISAADIAVMAVLTQGGAGGGAVGSTGFASLGIASFGASSAAPSGGAAGVVAGGGGVGSVGGSASAAAAVTAIGDGSSGLVSQAGKGGEDLPAGQEVTTRSYVSEPLTTSGGQGSGEALAGLGGSSAQSGDAQQALMVDKQGELSPSRIPVGEDRAESGVGVAETTKNFREMEAQTKLQDDIEITHAKVMSQILMSV